MPVNLIGLPQDNNSTYLTGPADAPDAIRDALHCDSSNLSTECGLDLGDTSWWQDLGDVALGQLGGQAAFDAIHTAITAAQEQGPVLALGGDHSVSWPAITACAAAHDGLSVLHLDAHPDLYDKMQDNPFSHASPFARLMETGRLTRLVQVGIRTLNPHQKAQADRFGVEIISMRNLATVSELAFDGPVYLSLDLDVLDPAYAPGVSHHEPGGLSTRQAIDLVQAFAGRLVGADLVELNPRRDLNGVTAMVAAKLAKEIVARLHRDSNR
ncbi:MAG: agmatinase family protein [Pseudomonadota bacterium]